jgi:hypothetical protein
MTIRQYPGAKSPKRSAPAFGSVAQPRRPFRANFHKYPLWPKLSSKNSRPVFTHRYRRVTWDEAPQAISAGQIAQ